MQGFMERRVLWSATVFLNRAKLPCLLRMATVLLSHAILPNVVQKVVYDISASFELECYAVNTINFFSQKHNFIFFQISERLTPHVLCTSDEWTQDHSPEVHKQLTPALVQLLFAHSTFCKKKNFLFLIIRSILSTYIYFHTQNIILMIFGKNCEIFSVNLIDWLNLIKYQPLAGYLMAWYYGNTFLVYSY